MSLCYDTLYRTFSIANNAVSGWLNHVPLCLLYSQCVLLKEPFGFVLTKPKNPTEFRRQIDQAWKMVTHFKIFKSFSE